MAYLLHEEVIQLDDIVQQGFQWIFRGRVINRLYKEVFSQIPRAIYCLPYGFWPGCIIFVILLLCFLQCKWRWHVEVVIFYIFQNDRIQPKNVWLKQKSTKSKNYVKIYARYKHCAKKHVCWMVYVGTYDCYENIKIKFWSRISLLKLWHCRNF